MASSPQILTADEIEQLRLLAPIVIPASAKYEMPAADDTSIFQLILIEAGHDPVGAREALALLHEIAGVRFGDVRASQRISIAEAFQLKHPDAALRIAGVIVRAYYRDDRVMKAIGMEPRPPFPKGFEVEQGDWSLLDPVRNGPVRYRAVP